MIYELTMTYCVVALRMAIHLFVLPCIVPLSFSSHLFDQRYLHECIRLKVLHVFDIRVVNNKMYCVILGKFVHLRFVFFIRPYILQALQRGYSQIF